MFKRPGDPEEHLQLYAIPAGALLAALAAGQALGVPEVTSMAYLASAGLCIGSIGCLSNQSTARTGNALGLIGVGTGIAATLGGMTGDPAVLGQVLGALLSRGVDQNKLDLVQSGLAVCNASAASILGAPYSILVMPQVLS